MVSSNLLLSIVIDHMSDRNKDGNGDRERDKGREREK